MGERNGGGEGGGRGGSRRWYEDGDGGWLWNDEEKKMKNVYANGGIDRLTFTKSFSSSTNQTHLHDDNSFFSSYFTFHQRLSWICTSIAAHHIILIHICILYVWRSIVSNS